MAKPYSLIKALADYAVSAELISDDDRVFCTNALLDITKTAPCPSESAVPEEGLHGILNALVEDAVARGIIDDDIESRDIFDTRLMAAEIGRASCRERV